MHLHLRCFVFIHGLKCTKSCIAMYTSDMIGCTESHVTCKFLPL